MVSEIDVIDKSLEANKDFLEVTVFFLYLCIPSCFVDVHGTHKLGDEAHIRY